jgi:hypothetical protein
MTDLFFPAFSGPFLSNHVSQHLDYPMLLKVPDFSSLCVPCFPCSRLRLHMEESVVLWGCVISGMEASRFPVSSQ